MGFKETFTKGSSDDLVYDDSAFLYFFISILTVIFIPLAYNVMKSILFNKQLALLKHIPNHPSD